MQPANLENPVPANNHRLAFWLVVALIVYGSLFPFHFQPHALAWTDVWHLLHPSAELHRSDLIANLLLFLPFGAFLAAGAAPGAGIRWRGLTGGAALAFGLQVLQLWFPDRDPNGMDGVLNLCGMVLGYLGWHAARPWLERLHPASRAQHRLGALASTLMLLWLLDRWFPLVPTLDWQNIKNGLKPLLDWYDVSGVAVLRHMAGWLVFFRLARYSPIQAWPLPGLWGLSSLIVVAEPLFLGNVLGPANVLGLLAAWGASTVLRSGAGTMWVVFLVLVISIVLAALVPFALGPGGTFGWVPFAGTLSGDPVRSLAGWIEKAYQYGSLVFLMRYLGVSHWTTCAAVGGLLGGLELTQTLVAGRTGEISDPLLALALAFWMRPLFASRSTMRPSLDR